MKTSIIDFFLHTVQTERQYSEETTKIHKQVKDTHTRTYT